MTAVMSASETAYIRVRRMIIFADLREGEAVNEAILSERIGLGSRLN